MPCDSWRGDGKDGVPGMRSQSPRTLPSGYPSQWVGNRRHRSPAAAGPPQWVTATPIVPTPGEVVFPGLGVCLALRIGRCDRAVRAPGAGAHRVRRGAEGAAGRMVAAASVAVQLPAHPAPAAATPAGVQSRVVCGAGLDNRPEIHGVFPLRRISIDRCADCTPTDGDPQAVHPPGHREPATPVAPRAMARRRDPGWGRTGR